MRSSEQCLHQTIEEVKFRMKVLINKDKNKVLFAEVDHDLADILISFLTLPLGTIVRLLSEHYGDEAPVIGSLNTLYKGLVDLDRSSFCTKLGKQMLIKPKSPFENHLVKLKINIDDTELTKYFTCESMCWRRYPVIYSMCYGTKRCACGKLMSTDVSSMVEDSETDGAPGVFTTETASFIITDDLQMLPNMIGYSLQILNNLEIKGANKVKEKTLLVGFKEIMDLLKGSLVSRTPLTDLIFNKTRHRVPDTEYFELGTVIGKRAAAATTTTTTTTSKKMTVKAIVQKSTGKILVAQAMEDFADFVFSLLTIPLGGALSLLGGDFSVGSIHNFHRSLSNLDGDRYLKSPNPFKTPRLPPKYLSKHQVLPLTEKSPSFIKSVILLDPKGQGSYVKGPATFMVTDDLVVTQSSAIFGLSILNSLDIPTSDTEEYVIVIGMEEGLSILRASLSSTSALSNGLEPFLKKRFKKPKLEK